MACAMESVMRTAVVLDQYPLWLEAVEPVLEHAGLSVVGKATAPRQALILVGRHTPDVLVLGTSDQGSGQQEIEYIEEARTRAPEMKVIVLGTSDAHEDIAAAFQAGAYSYIVKTAHPDDIASGIRQAFDASVFFASSFDFGGLASCTADIDELSRPGLTRREFEILRLVAQGHSNGQLAQMLWVTEPTVKFHLSNVYRKLGVGNRTEASRWAHINGLLEADEDAAVETSQPAGLVPAAA